MFKKNNIDIFLVLMSLIIGVFLGYIIGNKYNKDENDINVLKEEKIEYIYVLQIAKFDNPTGAANYQKALKDKSLDSIVLYDKVYYYIYGGIGSSEESLDNIKNKFILLGYNPIIKKELLIEKANSVLDDEILYNFYCECINNLYLSLENKDFEISDRYNVEPINIELFTQITILKTIKNENLRMKAQLQAYKLICESL